jgi:phosphonate transport system substrate-binding protein
MNFKSDELKSEILHGELLSLRTCIFIVMIFISISCGDAKRSEAPPEAPDKPKIVIGLIPEQNIFDQKERYEKLFDVVEQGLNCDLQTRILSGYGKVLENFKNKRVSGALLGSYSTVFVHKSFNTKLVATQVNSDGKFTYRGLIIKRKESVFSDEVSTWKGASFGMVDAHTSAGFVFPVKVFREAGIVDYRRFLGDTYFFGSHDAVVHAVWDHRVDMGAMKDTIFQKVVQKNPKMAAELEILKRSEEYPAITLVMRTDVPANLLKDISRAFLELHTHKKGQNALRDAGLKKFIPPVQKSYESLWKLIQRIGPDTPGKYRDAAP